MERFVVKKPWIFLRFPAPQNEKCDFQSLLSGTLHRGALGQHMMCLATREIYILDDDPV